MSNLHCVTSQKALQDIYIYHLAKAVGFEVWLFSNCCSWATSHTHTHIPCCGVWGSFAVAYNTRLRHGWPSLFHLNNQPPGVLVCSHTHIRNCTILCMNIPLISHYSQWECRIEAQISGHYGSKVAVAHQFHYTHMKPTETVSGSTGKPEQKC